MRRRHGPAHEERMVRAARNCNNVLVCVHGGRGDWGVETWFLAALFFCSVGVVVVDYRSARAIVWVRPIGDVRESPRYI